MWYTIWIIQLIVYLLEDLYYINICFCTFIFCIMHVSNLFFKSQLKQAC